MWELALACCAAVWGATFYLVKDAVGSVDPAILVAYRFLLSAALLSPWALRRGARRLMKEAAILSALLSALYLTQTVGLRYTTASNSGFITGLFVVFVPLFLLFKRPPTAAQWASSLLALAGLWLLTGGVSRFNRGDALTLVAAAAYAGHLLATDAFVRADADPVVLAFHQFWMTGAVSLAAGLMSGASLSAGGARPAEVIVFLALFPTLSAFVIQMLGQKRIAPLKVSLIFSLEPVFAALFAWTLGGEAFLPARAAGGALIVAAMVFGELAKGRPARGRAKEVLPA